MSTLPNKSDSVPPPPRPIRFVHNQGQPPSKRRRINAAYVWQTLTTKLGRLTQL